ncbi:hypothetical protein [Rhodopirellula europaea]|uniref:hypothetical protein n=1 Tax=Rhodopirellula europaea TaxID=1263866 RepID=UPI001181927A|nr:hypothetical protein [Rhodopirellula europaea]
MRRFSLQTLALIVALVAVAIGWWVDSSREPQIYYLHYYSNRYRPSHDLYHPDYDAPLPNSINTRLATIAISPNIPFRAEFPNGYDPTITISGTLTRSGQLFSGTVLIDVQDPGAAIEFDHATPIPIDTLVPFFDSSHHLAVSRNPDPYSLKYDVGQLN